VYMCVEDWQLLCVGSRVLCTAARQNARCVLCLTGGSKRRCWYCLHACLLLLDT
jgi:hypothetical protein